MKTLLLMLISMSLFGCATVFKGAQEEVRLESDPPGARVYVNQEFYGLTPQTLKLAPNKPYYVDLKLPGYELYQGVMHPNFQVGWLIAEIIIPGGAIAGLVDAATGAWNSLPETVSYKLQAAGSGQQRRSQ